MIVSDSVEVNGWTLGIGVGVFAVVFLTDQVDRRLPGALIALVGSTILVGALNLTSTG